MSTYVGLAAHSRAPSCDFLGLRGCDFQSRAESVGFSRQSFQCGSNFRGLSGVVQTVDRPHQLPKAELEPSSTAIRLNC